MYLEVYPDIIFLLNFFLDFILLSILKRVNRKEGSIRRRLLASACGGAASVIAGIFPGMNIMIRFIIMNIVTAALMLLLCFGRMKWAEMFRQLVSLYLITYFVGGLMNSVYYNTDMAQSLIRLGNTVIYHNISLKFVVASALILIPVVFLLLWLFRWYRSINHVIFEVELFLQGRGFRTRGLFDTGNCLYDPIFKKPVIIIENSLLEKLLPSEKYLELMKVKACMEGKDSGYVEREGVGLDLPSLQVIPYQSVGKQHGMMLALVLDKVLIFKGKETICNEKVTAAICDNCLSTKEEYHVILHKEFFV